ncbi:Adenine-specific DNA methylase, N12 class [Faecalicatena contorta]|uniref:Adenine-specific DNA methylase, N12 class n=1 Tax=Faecalicatena contorta TaxID=39482 RepID=A0A315ZRQ6_9FIRM|nr:helicase-related protein [Faecalicatena contorta]PWJ47803.1 N12 class adenine-specific DNA methylase [Faecalicatena contorta]SUQ15797.1 Adenine-specific DNA methylase, N12 class [Faecalicatena contorta]
MAKKLDLITDLYASAIKEVTAKPEHWTAFLRSACRNYRLPFDDQLLIHVQRPDASAVLEMEDWNRKFGRWVKRDAKGIAVFDKSVNTMRLKYYFDISDTKEGRYRRLVRPVPLWEVGEKYRQAVQETIYNAFGVAEETTDFVRTVLEAAKNAADDNISDYMQDILVGRENSFLVELDEYSVEVEAKNLLANSIAYMMLIRCGIQPEEYLEVGDFRWIMDFNTPQLANLFGAMASEVSEMALSEVADTVRKLQLEEKSKKRTFEESNTEGYNEIKKTENDTERSLEDEENHIQQAGRLPVARLNRSRRTGSTSWEVRLTPPELPEGASVRNVSQSVDTGQIEPAFDGSTSRGNESDGTAYSRDGEGTEGDGGVESRKSDAVAGNDEQYQELSRGNGNEGTDLQLVWYDRSSEDHSLPFFGKEEDIKSLLLSTPHLKATKEEVQAFYESHEDKEERTEYIKSIFNDEYTEITLEDKRRVGYKTYQNVLHMWEGSYLSRTSQSYYDWDVIANYFEAMRLLGELKDKSRPLPTVREQMTFLEELAEEKTSAFSFSQEVVDYALARGSGMQNGKFRIYSYFMQGHSQREKEKFLKKEYGIGGCSSILSGSGIGEMHDGKGLKLHQGYQDNAPHILLKWNQVVKRIDELIAAERYLSKKEVEYLPEYEKKELAAEIYHFYYNQPAEILRPYERGAGYHSGVDAIRPQLDDSGRIAEMIQSMEEVLNNTADFDRNYSSMQKAYNDLMDYRDGVYSLFTLIPSEKEIPTLSEPQPEVSREDSLATRLNEFYREYDLSGYQDNMETGQTQEDMILQLVEQLQSPESVQQIMLFLNGITEEMEPEDDLYPELQMLITEISGLPSMNPPYDLQIGTTVYIGIEEYEIQSLTDDIVVLRDLMYPLFIREMHREEFYRKLRENPANDSLKSNQSVPKSPAENKNREDTGSLSESEEPETEIPLTEEKEQTVKEDQQPKEEEDLSPAWEKQKSAGKVQSFDLYPEVPQNQRHQYKIHDDELGKGTSKEKFQANMAAIRVLKQCEAEERYASADEQEMLSNYVGWGALSDAFDETKSTWSNEFLELKDILTEEEYTAARQSTLTAFYTPPAVIRSIYQALENMGLRTGNILEPSCGIGNFIGMKPESVSDCKIYGVELDSVSGRIAGQLYQKSTIAVQGYEEVELPDSFFDVALGNVPFGQFKVPDKRYDRQNFLIHDYFFGKTLDKVRPGGVIAFITSSGTMDKKNSSVRKYIAQRAELLGAIRLPNDTFKQNAGTEVTADILFFQKRDRMVEVEPDWMYLDTDENGILQNSYFVQHPEMVLGEMVMESTQYGMESTCRSYKDRELAGLLEEAVKNIQAEFTEYEVEELVEEQDNTIPADPSVVNFSYAVFEGKIYYRENSRMRPVDLSMTAANRVKGMIAIRDCTRELITYQTEEYSESVIENQQKKLNTLYDAFYKKYGLLNARANALVFSDDNSYPLLCSLEILAEDGTLERKADMFTKRTIKPHAAVTKVDTSSEALSLSLAEKACVDMEYMCSLVGKSAEEIEQDLAGVIFRVPGEEGAEPQFVSEDEYLSGNVREKLKQAKVAAKVSAMYQPNVEALEKVQPKELSASEISVRLGSTWIPSEDIADFMFYLLDTPNYVRWNIKVHFSKFSGEWNIEGKSNDKGNVKANNTYGTHRVNAYKIVEDTLNLRDTRVYDYEMDDEGKRKAVLNKKETAIAQGKQDLIKQAFQDWIWQDPERRQRLTSFYNEHFNAVRPREYDGSHLHFYGMNPEKRLDKHQLNGAARIIYGGNTLLAYVVGAGKTYTMVAAAMELKRLGLCNKSMVVVPNHIIEQFGADWMELYPAANILVATKKDFEKKNRKKFCARIATSDIDAVIIGHSQFEKIPLSAERQCRMLEMEIAEIVDGIVEEKRNRGSRFTIKQMEKTKKTLQGKLAKLNDQSRKDDVVCFEELGIDRLFVDEADLYKNLYLYTKMRNVGGIAQTEAQKSSDMFMKCRYLDEVTGGRGVIFATGTPISNSMVELYTMQRYLQYNTLVAHGLQHFDAWASTFGETVTAIELAPEGTGYRLKTRFAKFYNLPELMMMFREVADIQTADMLKLPVPEAEYRVVTTKPSKIQQDMVAELGTRAECVRNGMVNATEDNMLLITNDGRKLALDQRLINPMLTDSPESKVNACVNEVHQFWEEGKEKKLTQLLFCDLSTPKTDGSFSVYNDMRDKLIEKGIPSEEIAFIHHANTEIQKKGLFSKVRHGAVRVLMGSTSKMGAGTNVQNLIVASHDLDCPWRPRDLEQRAGRSIRRGNRNKKVSIVRYITEGTFDAYLYQIIENKQKFISQIMTSKSPARTVEDIDEVALSYAEIKALATGNPYIKEKMDLDIQVSKLQLLKQNFLSQRYELEDKATKQYPAEIKRLEERITAYQEDIAQVKEFTPSDREVFPPMQINGITYTEKQEAGKAIVEACKAMKSPDGVELGAYRGMKMELAYNTFAKEFVIALKRKLAYHVSLGTDIHGNITRLDNEITRFEDNLERCREKLENTKVQLETARVEAQKPFSKEQELSEKTARLGELNALLDMDKKDKVILDEEQEEVISEKRVKEPER